MGIPLNLFLEPSSIMDDLLCRSCRQVLEEPVMLQPCEHTFCQPCLDSHHDRNTATQDVSVLSCPVDEKAIIGSKKPPAIYANLLAKLELRCSFHAEGCGAKMQLDVAFFEHRLHCEFNPNAPKPCDGDCGAILVASELPNHSCAQYLKKENEELKAYLLSQWSRKEKSPSLNTTADEGSSSSSSNPTRTRPPINITRAEVEIIDSSLVSRQLPEIVAQIVFEELTGNEVSWPRTVEDCLNLSISLQQSLETKSGLPGRRWAVIVNRDDLPQTPAIILRLLLGSGTVNLKVRDLKIGIYGSKLNVT